MTAQASRDVTEQTFQQDVIERSQQVPVVIDFWAPWCGPCRTLGPTLEKLAREANGAWVLAKVNVDENPRLAQAFRVQGIPAVKAVVGGKLADEFTGALPESQVRAWLQRFVQASGGAFDDLEELATTNPAEAAARYRVVLGSDPTNEQALFGLGTLLLRSGEDEAAALLAEIPATSPLAGRAQAAADLLPLVQAAGSATEGAAGQYAHAGALVRQGNDEAALDALLLMVQRHRSYNNDAARKAMLALLALLGDEHPLVGPYRRNLASALF